jgi:hypothetical protein
MKLIHITYTDKGSLGWNIFGWAVSFREFFSIKIYRYLAFNFGRVFARIIKPYEKLNNNGSSFTIIFRKNI